MRKFSSWLKPLWVASMLVLCLTQGTAQSQPFTAMASDVPLFAGSKGTVSAFLEAIHKRFQVDIVYEASRLPKEKVEFEPGQYNNAEQALNDLLTPLGYTFKKLSRGSYSVVPAGKVKPGAGKDSMDVDEGAATQIEAGGKPDTSFVVKGKVTDEKTGAPIVGVSVVVKGKAVGTQTDIDGMFSIGLNSSGDVLVLTVVGYEAKEYKPDGQALVDITLNPSAAVLSDVVVVGYGTRSRKSLTTSVSSISAKEVVATPVADAAQALQGRIAGVTITQNSGAPGGTGGTSIRIRVISSLTGTNNPLIVVDG